MCIICNIYIYILVKKQENIFDYVIFNLKTMFLIVSKRN